MKINKEKQFDVSEIEKVNAKIVIIKKIGKDTQEVTFIFNEDDGYYYAKGAFARWDTVCYLRFPYKDENLFREWMDEFKEADYLPME